MELELNHFEIDKEGGREIFLKKLMHGESGLTKTKERDLGLFT